MNQNTLEKALTAYLYDSMGGSDHELTNPRDEYAPEARRLASYETDKLKRRSYDLLERMAQEGHKTKEMSGPDGREYQLDSYAFIDDKKLKTIRVVVQVYIPREVAPIWQFWKNIDRPLVREDFIMLPDGLLL